jgi:hypothetical protein
MLLLPAKEVPSTMRAAVDAAPERSLRIEAIRRSHTVLKSMLKEDRAHAIETGSRGIHDAFDCP